MRRDEIEGEINARKNILDNTDYQILRAIEDIFAADGITELLSALANAGREITQTIRLRKECRARINELEAMTPEDEQEEPPSEEEPAVEAEGDAE
ncbi:hypothetical protein [Adlercreutzia sp.]|uniref:hypothetical protein n=1 Tax=Adlercreutzia sp. TaxID=1872387 RepID=UPI003AB6E936